MEERPGKMDPEDGAVEFRVHGRREEAARLVRSEVPETVDPTPKREAGESGVGNHDVCHRNMIVFCFF
jgi:hypothetical protein